jgi:catechol 2,3-dioxygenase-like lactoylglutathione lyase family enzyme
MGIGRFDHYNIKTAKPEETIRFYTTVLGLVNAPHLRPAVDRPGTWILVDGHPYIHVNFVEDDRAARTGAIDHLGFVGTDYEGLRDHLLRLAVMFEEAENRRANLRQIYVTDPNQIRIEINIPFDFGAEGSSAEEPR